MVVAKVVMRHQTAWRVLGNWETQLLASQLAGVPVDRPVFISGLARAGTTILLRKLCQLPKFASHRYSDFPFIFTPYLWALLRGFAPAKHQTPTERMHKDGIMVTAESPEALEEILWMAFFPHLHDPACSNVLDETARHPEFESFLTDHIRKLILARGGQRYVSKNNYNLTRLSYLARVFADARFLLPIRAPLTHVASLVKQHGLFCEIQRSSEAARSHLRLVGHFEFGLDRRLINPGDHGCIAIIEDCWKRREEVRGWAKYWAMMYRHLADRLQADPELAGRCLVVRYEDLCDCAAQTITSICTHLGLTSNPPEHLTSGLRQPDDYAAQFTDDERAAIYEETEEVAQRFGYLYPRQSEVSAGISKV